MCHVLLLLPFFALPLFWIFPASIAAPLYLAALLATGVLYWNVFRSARRPKLNGAEAMLGARGRVVKCGGRDVTVRFHGELWSARPAGGSLAVGDEVVVQAIDGLRLRVAPLRKGQ